MAKKHFEKYLEEVQAQYHEMNNDLKEMEEQVKNGMVNPEFLDRLKTMIAPLYNNWMTLNYVKFLLDMPNRKSKQPGYEKRNKKLLSQCKSKNIIINENDQVLKQLKEIDLN